MCFPVGGAKGGGGVFGVGQRIQRLGEDHGYLVGGSGGGAAGETREGSVYLHGGAAPGGQEVDVVDERQSSSAHLEVQVNRPSKDAQRVV